ncbi:Zn ribbon nucleic-acid-binding protein [Methanomicrobium sp. W14]|uniref:hypothetical protein n=1 Tax=Methanomicrobium sp. W14 TaxID=2817839 RepID=UPI001AE11A48|nr:hypothetical protein [Methanomicrobium sp. W14]MBP2132507.1 Zn ribbon nucleic-acid-binding protein [Methanomicrobium sp. W14]
MKKTSLHCPVCNSRDIYRMTGGFTGEIYICKKCGYRGALVVEYDNDLKDEFEKASSFRESEYNCDCGNFRAKTVLEIILVVLILLSAYAILSGF